MQAAARHLMPQQHSCACSHPAAAPITNVPYQLPHMHSSTRRLPSSTRQRQQQQRLAAHTLAAPAGVLTCVLVPVILISNSSSYTLPIRHLTSMAHVINVVKCCQVLSSVASLPPPPSPPPPPRQNIAWLCAVYIIMQHELSNTHWSDVLPAASIGSHQQQHCQKRHHHHHHHQQQDQQKQQLLMACCQPVSLMTF